MDNNLEYVAFDKEVAREFEQKMESNMLYRSTDNFMALYNNNFINRSNPEIDEVAKEIVEVYKNITLNNRRFIVKSKEEVISDEFELIFPHVSFIATLKRIAADILKDNYPEDTLIVFTEEDPNVVQVYDYTAEKLAPYEGAERIRNVGKSLSTNPFFVNNIEAIDYEEGGIAFKAIDVLKLDTSFINEIGELIEAYIK